MKGLVSLTRGMHSGLSTCPLGYIMLPRLLEHLENFGQLVCSIRLDRLKGVETTDAVMALNTLSPS